MKTLNLGELQCYAIDGLDSGSRARGSTEKYQSGLLKDQSIPLAICQQVYAITPPLAKKKLLLYKTAVACFQKLCLSDPCIMKVCPLRPPSHNDLSCHHWHGSILEAKPHLQWFRLPRCYVCRQVLLPTQRTDVIIHASSDFTIMLRLLQTSVPHLVGFLWLILNLDVSSPKVSERSGVDPLTLLEHCIGSRGQCANISWPTQPLQMSRLNGTSAFGYCLLVCLPLTHLMEVRSITDSLKKYARSK